MTRLPHLAPLFVSLFIVSCDASRSPANVPFFFARHVDTAEQDFDRNLFLSFRKDGLLAAPVTMNNETRLSLSPPLPSKLTFQLEVPLEPLLQFSIGVSSLGADALTRPVDFAIHVDSGGVQEVCFQETVRRGQSNTWFDRTVDLTPWSGKSIRLTFETSMQGTNVAQASGTLLPAWGGPVLDSSRQGGEGTNLVLISIDCLRADHLSAYGYHRNTTPHIDRFAAEGVLFENAVSVSSWTLPTHMSMLTGLMPSFHGANRSHKLSTSVPFLPEMLSRAGYETLGVVSGAYLSQAFGFERGFDSYRFLKDARAEYVVDAGLHLALESRGRRHFLFLHLFDAHWPYLPPREFLDRFDQRPPDISDIMPKIIYGKRPRGPEEIQHFVNLYDGEIAYLDQQLGRFFEGLREAGLYDRSLIVLTADHGESFYEHDMWQHSESLYQEVTHVPLLVKWPGGSPSGRVEHLVSQLHIFPTILERAGIDSPYADHQGLDQYASGEKPDPESVTSMSEIIWEPKETHGPSMKVSLRKGSLKYILTLTGETGDEQFVSEVVSEELYDLSQDPGERSNLLPDAARDVGGLRREVRQFIDQAQILQAERQGQEVVLDDELREQLKALGYIN